MAEGVTYADLRFTKSPPEKSRPPADMLHEEASNSEGELTYENCAPAQPCQPTGPGPDLQPPGALGGRILSTVLLALLGACLFLLATCLGLGLRYWQVSRQLEGASRRHRAESGALAQQLGGQEENLTRTLRLLSRAQEELSATSLALRQSREAGNRTRRQLEGEQERAENCLTQLQQEKDKGVRELEAARSCQKIGCCPPDWTLFRWKCFWVSGERKAWEESKQDCGRQRAQLLVLKPWDASTIWGAIVITNISDRFWVPAVYRLRHIEARTAVRRDLHQNTPIRL
ncbi:UNVERIFIED_CONTAM: hypothetical protein K2H54_068337 [Gekko kuhli]